MTFPGPSDVMAALSSFTMTDGMVWAAVLWWVAWNVRAFAFADGARGNHAAQRQGQWAAVGVMAASLMPLSFGTFLGHGDAPTLWTGLAALCCGLGQVNLLWWRRTGKLLF